MNGQAALGLGSIVNRLLYVFPCSAFKAIHIDTLRLFTNAMTDLTCSFLQAVAKEEEVSDENGFKSLLLHYSYPNKLFRDTIERQVFCPYSYKTFI